MFSQRKTTWDWQLLFVQFDYKSKISLEVFTLVSE